MTDEEFQRILKKENRKQTITGYEYCPEYRRFRKYAKSNKSIKELLEQCIKDF